MFTQTTLTNNYFYLIRSLLELLPQDSPLRIQIIGLLTTREMKYSPKENFAKPLLKQEELLPYLNQLTIKINTELQKLPDADEFKELQTGCSYLQIMLNPNFSGIVTPYANAKNAYEEAMNKFNGVAENKFNELPDSTKQNASDANEKFNLANALKKATDVLNKTIDTPEHYNTAKSYDEIESIFAYIQRVKNGLTLKPETLASDILDCPDLSSDYTIVEKLNGVDQDVFKYSRKKAISNYENFHRKAFETLHTFSIILETQKILGNDTSYIEEKIQTIVEYLNERSNIFLLKEEKPAESASLSEEKIKTEESNINSLKKSGMQLLITLNNQDAEIDTDLSELKNILLKLQGLYDYLAPFILNADALKINLMGLRDRRYYLEHIRTVHDFLMEKYLTIIEDRFCDSKENKELLTQNGNLGSYSKERVQKIREHLKTIEAAKTSLVELLNSKENLVLEAYPHLNDVNNKLQNQLIQLKKKFQRNLDEYAVVEGNRLYLTAMVALTSKRANEISAIYGHSQSYEAFHHRARIEIQMQNELDINEQDPTLAFHLLRNSFILETLQSDRKTARKDKIPLSEMTKRFVPTREEYFCKLTASSHIKKTNTNEIAVLNKQFEDSLQMVSQNPTYKDCVVLRDLYLDYAKTIYTLIKNNQIKNKNSACKLAKGYIEEAALWNYRAYLCKKPECISEAQKKVTVELCNLERIFNGKTPIEKNNPQSFGKQKSKSKFGFSIGKGKAKEANKAETSASFTPLKLDENHSPTTLAQFFCHVLTNNADEFFQLKNSNPTGYVQFLEKSKSSHQKMFEFTPLYVDAKTAYIEIDGRRTKETYYSLNGEQIPKFDSDLNTIDFDSISEHTKILLGYQKGLRFHIHDVHNFLRLNPEDAEINLNRIEIFLKRYNIDNFIAEIDSYDNLLDSYIENLRQAKRKFLDLQNSEKEKTEHYKKQIQTIESYEYPLQRAREKNYYLKFLVLIQRSYKELCLDDAVLDEDSLVNLILPLNEMTKNFDCDSADYKIKIDTTLQQMSEMNDLYEQYSAFQHIYISLKEAMSLMEVYTSLYGFFTSSLKLEQYKNSTRLELELKSTKVSFQAGSQGYENALVTVKNKLKTACEESFKTNLDLYINAEKLLRQLEGLEETYNSFVRNLGLDAEKQAKRPLPPVPGVRRAVQRASFGASLLDKTGFGASLLDKTAAANVLGKNPIVTDKKGDIDHDKTKDNIHFLFGILDKCLYRPTSYIGYLENFAAAPDILFNHLMTALEKHLIKPNQDHAKVGKIAKLKMLARVLQCMTYNLLCQDNVKTILKKEGIKINLITNPWDKLTAEEKDLGELENIQHLFKELGLMLPASIAILVEPKGIEDIAPPNTYKGLFSVRSLEQSNTSWTTRTRSSSKDEIPTNAFLGKRGNNDVGCSFWAQGSVAHVDTYDPEAAQNNTSKVNPKAPPAVPARSPSSFKSKEPEDLSLVEEKIAPSIKPWASRGRG